MIWAGSFVLLTQVLPPSPLWRFGGEEPLQFLGLAEDSSAVLACDARAEGDSGGALQIYLTWPIKVLDLQTGNVRSIDLPEPESTGTNNDDGPHHHLAGDYGIGSGQGQFALSGDLFAQAYMPLEGVAQQRLCVINWRTGAVIADHPYPSTGNFRFVGTRLLVHQVRDGEGRLEFWDLESGQVTPLEAFGRVDDFGSLSFSGDHRWALERTSEGRRPVIEQNVRFRLMDLVDGQVRPLVPEGTEAAAFSSDGRRLALLGPWTMTIPQRHERPWCLIDLPSGKAIQTETQVSVVKDVDWWDIGNVLELEIMPGLETVRCRQGQEIVDWSESGFTKKTAPRPFVSARSLFPQSRYPYVEISPDERWAIALSDRKADMFKAGRAVDAFVHRMTGFRLIEPFTHELWDLTTERHVATLTSGAEDVSWFTPDSSRAITTYHGKLDVWALPPGPPWRKAFLWSLIVPAAVALGLLRRSRHLRLQAASIPRSVP